MVSSPSVSPGARGIFPPFPLTFRVTSVAFYRTVGRFLQPAARVLRLSTPRLCTPTSVFPRHGTAEPVYADTPTSGEVW